MSKIMNIKRARGIRRLPDGRPPYSLDAIRDAVRDRGPEGYPVDPFGGVDFSSPNDNVILRGAKPDYTFGWFGPILTRLAKSRSFALALNPYNSVTMITANGPTQMIYDDVDDLLGALRIAAQGVAIKAVGQGTVVLTPTTTNLTVACTPANTRAFGVRVTVSNPPQSFPFGRVFLALLDGSTELYRVAMDVATLPASIVMLSIQGAGGPASVVGMSNPQVTLTNTGDTQPSAVIPGTTYMSVETLNIRDLGSPMFVNQPGMDYQNF